MEPRPAASAATDDAPANAERKVKANPQSGGVNVSGTELDARNDALSGRRESAATVAAFHVRGKVVDSSDHPVAASVRAKSSHGAQETTTDANGRFDLSMPGSERCTRFVDSPGGAFAPSTPIEVDPGANVTIRMFPRASTIFGTVVDAVTGQPREVEVEFEMHGADSLSNRGMVLARDGQWTVDARLPGTYALSARAPDGKWAVVTGIEVARSSDVGPIRLELAPCAKLSVRYTGSATWLDCIVSTGGHELGRMGFSPQRGYSCEVPAGEITVQLSEAKSTQLRTRTVTAKPGEQVEVVFD
jgi:hypothetical protein